MPMSEIVTERYQRKPVYVDAVKVTEENFRALAMWCDAEIKMGPEGEYIAVRVSNPTNPRQWQARVGDWILYSPTGYKVYIDRSFQRNFTKVETEE